MAENLIDLKRRINSVKNTQKITRAMKTVAAAKLRKSRTERFMKKIEYLLNKVGKELDYDNFPLFEKREEGKVVIIALSSDKGLCGAFNSHVIKKIENYYKDLERNNEKVLFITAGNKVYRDLNKKGFVIEENYKSMMSDLEFSDAVRLSEYLQEIYLNKDIKKVVFIYTEFISSSTQETTVKQILPLEIEREENEIEEQEIEYIFEP
jgi:F-type H+-transporting ATPase subunit gamma